MNHGARDGSRVRIPKRDRFFLFFFSFFFFSVPKRRYTITRDCGLTARSMVVPGGRSPPLRPMLIGAVKPGAGPPPIPVRFRVRVGLGT